MDNCGRFHIPALYSIDFFTAGFTLVPNLLLKYNTRLALEKMELLVFLALFYFQQCGRNDCDLVDFAQLLNVTEKEIGRTIEAMSARGLLAINGKKLEATGLFEKIADIWAEEKVQALQQERRETPAVIMVKTNGRNQTSSYLNNLVNTFEEEFGRPLTPIECSQIFRWYRDDGYSEELILDALKRGVLRGICNLNYIDKILGQWQKNNLRTTCDVSQYEEKYQEQRQRRKGKARHEGVNAEDKEEKYKDLYLT